jgi:DNA-binding transcriptional LysR family regulator
VELRHLRYFVAVAEHGGFTRAAAALRVAQPPVSRQIAQLEAELGVILFVRSGRTISLTEAGERFLEDTRRILDDVDRSVARVRGIAAAASTLRVDFVPSSFAWVVPEILRLYQARGDGGEIRLSERRPHEIIAALHDSASDVGFIHQARPLNDGTLEMETVFREPLVAALPTEHRLVSSASVELADLADDDFVLNQGDPRGGLRSTIVELCRAAGFTPRVRQDAWLQQTTLGLVAAGLGVTLAPRSASFAGRVGVAYLPLRDCRVTVSVDMLWRRDLADRQVESFLTAARDWASEAADGKLRRRFADEF